MSSPNHPLTVGSRFGPYRLDRPRGMGEVLDDLHLFVVVTGSIAEYPGNSPKNDAALLAWFQQHFTT
ncbi:hypothetical protein [Nocardia sp. NPDC046763]|uniref:hypothetical protein n=1 Tax=Nocardia sp. NPDC046763 TaxID=3155256 RepID=UPI0033C3556E